MQHFWEESIDVSIQVANNVKYKLSNSKNEFFFIDYYFLAMTTLQLLANSSAN